MENLIILGAGGYGRTAAETARAMGVFGRVAFLDDGCTGTDVLGPCTDYIRFAGEFRWAYPAFGANALRAAWLEKLPVVRDTLLNRAKYWGMAIFFGHPWVQ